MWTLVRIRATGQIVEMLPQVAQGLIDANLAEAVERVETKTLVQHGRELAARFCNAIGGR